MPRNASQIYSVPVGTDGIPNTIIYSGKYNTFIHDVETDLNTPRPINAGGTGATDAATALQNINGEMAGQVVNNYDSFAFVDGSFYSPPAATNPPVAGHAFAGTCYSWKANTTDFFIEARDLNDSNVPGLNYVRRKTAGVWGAWALADQSARGYADTKVAKAGDTMTGLLTLSGDPSTALQAVTKQYVDARVAYQEVTMAINGSMQISQQNAGNTVVISSGNAAYTVDGFTAIPIGAPSCQVTQYMIGTSTAPGFPGHIVVVSTSAIASPAAGDVLCISQAIEGRRIAKLQWGAASQAQPLSVGFYLWSNIGGKVVLAIRNNGGTRSYIVDIPVTANIWNWCTATVPGDTTGSWQQDSSVGMFISIGLTSGSTWQGVAGWQAGNKLGSATGMNFSSSTSNQILITGFVAMMGTQIISPTQASLMMPNYDQELQVCRRYYQNIAASIDFTFTAAGAFGTTSINFPVEMRSVPLFTQNRIAPVSGNVTQSWALATNRSVAMQGTSLAAGRCYYYADVWADARL